MAPPLRVLVADGGSLPGGPGEFRGYGLLTSGLASWCSLTMESICDCKRLGLVLGLQRPAQVGQQDAEAQLMPDLTVRCRRPRSSKTLAGMSYSSRTVFSRSTWVGAIRTTSS